MWSREESLFWKKKGTKEGQVNYSLTSEIKGVLELHVKKIPAPLASRAAGTIPSAVLNLSFHAHSVVGGCKTEVRAKTVVQIQQNTWNNEVLGQERKNLAFIKPKPHWWVWEAFLQSWKRSICDERVIFSSYVKHYYRDNPHIEEGPVLKVRCGSENRTVRLLLPN